MLSPKYWTFLVIVIAAIGYSIVKPREEIKELIVSPNDHYQYKVEILENGLPVLLVHAPEQDKAAAAMTVSVGSGDDPKDRAGLAHFLEHMLFLGTEAYPEPGEYQNFISQNGGSHNAFTAHGQTTYFFEIDNDELSGALDRFAPFFISPTFNEEYVDREKNAVHAEFTSKLKDDFRRIYSAEKQAMNPEHPFSTFSTGNLDTLSDTEESSIRDDLLAFYQAHYSADKMALVVAGNYSLDQLSQWVNTRFTNIPNRATETRSQDEPLFKENQLPLDIYIEPVKEIRRLQFTFALPEVRSIYQYKPLQMIANLIGHEGEGSLLALLKKQGWAEGLSAGRSLSTAEETSLVVQIQLTKNGANHIDDITSLLFSYIDKLTEKPLPDYLFDEQIKLSELAFNYKEHGQLSNYVVGLSTNLTLFPQHDAIYGNYRTEKPTPELINKFLSRLTPNNMLRSIILPNVTTNTVDPIYDTPLRILPSEFDASQQVPESAAALHLPKANPFIPEDLTLYANTSTNTPKALIHTEQQQVWYYPEQEFKTPRSQVNIKINLPSLKNDLAQRVNAQLYARFVNESLNTYSYPAYLAGLSYNLSANARGLDITISGYQDKLPVLLETIFETMLSVEITADAFERYQASLIRGYENSLKDKPFRRTIAEVKRWLFIPSFSEQEYIDQINRASVADVETFTATFKSQVATTSLIHGQLNEEKAQQIGTLINEHFPSTVSIQPLNEVVQAPVGIYQKSLDLDHPDSAISLYVQGHDTSDRHRAEIALLAQILSAPYYKHLRTDKQLGYVVFAAAFPQQTVPGLIFIVQSPTAKPKDIIAESEAFFAEFKNTLGNMPEEEFIKYQEGLITLLTEKPKNMTDKANLFWRDINIGRKSFDTNSAIAEQVKTLTLKDIQNLYQVAILDKDMPHLLFSQGGKVKGYQPLSVLKREKLERFFMPDLTAPALSNDVRPEDNQASINQNPSVSQ